MPDTTDLHVALRHALAATAETDPRDLAGPDLALFNFCDQKIEQIIEVLIAQHDEAGPATRAILRRFMLG